jgi:hypothetical protein
MLKLTQRLTVLEAAREAQIQAWLHSLSEKEFAVVVDETYGPGTWDWLCAETNTMTLEEIECPGELWGRFLRWREAQP